MGNAASFALTAGLAKLTGAGLLLRIDDMDRERITDAYIQDVFETLHFLGIDWTEGPRSLEEFESVYSQRRRMNLYNEALRLLRESGKVYACSCSRTQIAGGIYPGTCRHRGLSLDAENVAWRLDTQDAGQIKVRTLKDENCSSVLPADMQDFIVRKKDGFPAYQLCSLVDDLHFGIDLVVRGEDLRSSTLAQLHLAKALGKDEFLGTTFYHHPLLVDASQRKLSKSAGDASLRHWRQEGRSAKEIYNFLGRQMGLDKTVNSWENLTSLFGQ